MDWAATLRLDEGRPRTPTVIFVKGSGMDFDPEYSDETNETVESLVSVWDLVTDGSLFLRRMPHPLGQCASYGNSSSLRIDTPKVSTLIEVLG